MRKFILICSCTLLVLRISAQDESADNLRRTFENYQTKTLQEKLFIQTDKTFYLAGETIWFKIFCVDANVHRPLSLSKIAYVELIGKDQKSILQTKIALDSGMGWGSMTLPTSLVTGNYLFRGYTGWMKNFPPEFYYEQILPLVNTIKGSAPPPAAPARIARIDFFPEGGNLVAGFSSTVGFKAVNATGASLSCSGVVLNRQNDTIASFQSAAHGMGHFQMTPAANGVYHALVKMDDSVYNVRLPEINAHGYTMSLKEPDAGKIHVSVQATDEFANTTVYLFVHTSQIVKNVQRAQISNGNASFDVDRNSLGDGISSFTIFNADRRPVSERLYFKMPVNKLIITSTPDKTMYGNRSKVMMDLQSTDLTHTSVPANLSMSVIRLDDLQGIPTDDIYSFLLLTADLRGNIESPAEYLNGSDATTAAALNDLLLTQGWRRFKWSDVLNSNTPAFEFLPEIEGLVINGKVIDKKSGLPQKKVSVYLSVPGNRFSLSNSTSNSEGNIQFSMTPYYGNNQLVLQNVNPSDSGNRVDILSPFSDKFSGTIPGTLVLPGNAASLLTTRNTAVQVDNAYQFTKKHHYLPTAQKDSLAFYGKPDRQYNLDDFTRFVTMEEVLREYVDDVRIRKDADKFHFRVRNFLFGTFFDEEPLILLDGIPTTDAGKIVALPPLRIRQIDVVNHRYFMGTAAVEGIVSVRSYDGQVGPTQLDPNAVVIEYDGLQQQREFYSPQYSDPTMLHDPVPDYRSLLLWSPHISTDASGKTQLTFYTSDVTGKYAVLVQGLTSQGLAGSAVTTFSVSAQQ